jgi:predicted ATP-binding protein involved in virulence
MKIRKLHIKNYKVFNDLELDFTDANGKTLDKIVLAGVNGMGKTMILELIKKMYDGTLFNYTKEFQNTTIEVELEIFKKEKEVFNKYSSADTQRQSNLFDIKSRLNGSDFITLHYYGDKAQTPNELDLFFTSNNTLSPKSLNKLLYLPVKAMKTVGSSLQIINLESLKNKMSDLAVKSVREEIFRDKDRTLKQGIESGLKKITKALEGIDVITKLVDVESENLIFQSVNNQRITFEDLSNGEQNLYFRAIYLNQINPQNSIIMVDEPENALHPTWQQNIVKLYQNIGENNQIIVATHSPHIIGASNADEVFLLEIDENHVEATHPRYTKGHSIDYILEVMGANPRDTEVIKKVDAYLALIRKGEHESASGFKLKAEIDALKLDPNGEEMGRLDLSLRRFKVIGV